MVGHELAVGARTCTQPLSELATASVGCVEVSEPISGRRRRVWGSWYLQTVQTTAICGGARDQLALKLPVSLAPANSTES